MFGWQQACIADQLVARREQQPESGDIPGFSQQPAAGERDAFAPGEKGGVAFRADVVPDFAGYRIMKGHAEDAFNNPTQHERICTAVIESCSRGCPFAWFHGG